MLNRKIVSLLALAMLMGTEPLIAQEPPATQSSTRVPIVDQFLPNIHFEDQPLEEVIKVLTTHKPALNVVITRAPNVLPEYPKITLRARNLTMKQFMQFTSDLYGLEWREIPGPEGSLVIVNVPEGDRYVDYMTLNAKPPPPGSSPPPTLFSYNLRPILDYLNANKPASASRDQKSLEEVMSLLQEALTLAQVPNTDPQLKVHAPTSTLLFTGSGHARGVVERVLATLRPPEQPAAPVRGGQSSSQTEGRSGRGQ